MRNLVYHFRPANNIGGITIVHSREQNGFAVALCDVRDQFCRRTGIRIANTRLQSEHTGWCTGMDTFDHLRNSCFAGELFGLEPDSPKPDIDKAACILAYAVARRANCYDIMKSLIDRAAGRITAEEFESFVIEGE